MFIEKHNRFPSKYDPVGGRMFVDINDNIIIQPYEVAGKGRVIF